MNITFYREGSVIGSYQESKQAIYTEALIYAYVTQCTSFEVKLSYKKFGSFIMTCDFDSDTKFAGTVPTSQELLDTCLCESRVSSIPWVGIDELRLNMVDQISKFLEWAEEHDLYNRAEK